MTKKQTQFEKIRNKKKTILTKGITFQTVTVTLYFIVGIWFIYLASNLSFLLGFLTGVCVFIGAYSLAELMSNEDISQEWELEDKNQ